MGCYHDDFDDYFELCNDCGMTGEQIHDAECVPADDWFVMEDGICSRCGTITNILESEAA